MPTIFPWILAFCGALGILWMFVLPPFQGADESVHFARAHLAAYSLQTGFQNFEEASARCQKVLTPLLQEHRVAALRHNPLSSYVAPLANPHTRYSYLYDYGCKERFRGVFDLYYFLVAPLTLLASFAGPLLSFYMLRLVSLALFLGFLTIAYRSGKFLFPNDNKAIFLPLLIGLHPIALVAGVSVGYDALINFLFGFSFLMGIEFLVKKRGFPEVHRFLLWGGILSLVAIMTKMVGVLIPIFLILALIFSQRVPRKVLVCTVAIALFMIIGLVFGVRGYNFSIFQAIATLRQMNTPFYDLFVARWTIAFESFWGGWGSGWLDTYTPPFFLVIFAGIILWSLGGVALKFLRKSYSSSIRKLVFYAFACLVIFEIMATLYNLFLPELNYTESSFAQGRYYFPLLLPFFFLVTQGWKWPRFLFFLFCVYSFFYLGMVVIPRYYF